MAKNIVDTVVNFVGHYADEATVVANALTSLLDAVRPNSEVTATVKEAITILETAAGNIAKAKPPVPVTIKKADIEAAVKAYLDKNLAGAVAAAIAADKAK